MRHSLPHNNCCEFNTIFVKLAFKLRQLAVLAPPHKRDIKREQDNAFGGKFILVWIVTSKFGIDNVTRKNYEAYGDRRERTERAKCTVLVIELFLTNWVQAHDHYLEVLQHIILYFSTRRPQIIGYSGHVRTCFFWDSVSPRILSSEIISKKSKKNHQKKFAGLPWRPAPPPYRAAPPPRHQSRC